MDLKRLEEFLITNGAPWVVSQRDRHRPTAEPLSEALRQTFGDFFDASILESVRIKSVPAIENPDFYAAYSEANLTVLLNFSGMMAMTFDNTILLVEGRLPPEFPVTTLLFHELVHVVQYRILGIREFLRRYTQGWIHHQFNYFLIPIEGHAYELQSRFAADSREVFSVVSEVRNRLQQEGS